VQQIVTAAGSRLNGERSKLRRNLSDPDVRVIGVEYRDRLARFGVDRLVAALLVRGRRIVVGAAGGMTDDLVRNLIEVLTSMCARLYGRQGARDRTMRALAVAKREPGKTA
jgi:putative resolvase